MRLSVLQADHAFCLDGRNEPSVPGAAIQKACRIIELACHYHMRNAPTFSNSELCVPRPDTEAACRPETYQQRSEREQPACSDSITPAHRAQHLLLVPRYETGSQAQTRGKTLHSLSNYDARNPVLHPETLSTRSRAPPCSESSAEARAEPGICWWRKELRLWRDTNRRAFVNP